MIRIGVCLTALVLVAGSVGSVRAQLTWTEVVDIGAVETQALLVEADTLYVATVERVYRHPLGSSTWLSGNRIADTIDILSLGMFGDRLFAGTFDDGVFESTDGGQTWVARSVGLSGAGAKSIVAFAVRGDSIYAATDGASVFAMNGNSGTTWSPFRTDIPSLYAWTSNSLNNINDMLFLGSGQSGTLYRNLSGTTAWEEQTLTGNINSGLIAFGFGIRDTLLLAAASNGIYTSTDSGATWTRYAAPFAVGYGGTVVVTPHRTFVMLAHGSQGAFVFEWNGSGWTTLDQLPVIAFDFAYFDGRLWMARFDGLYSTPLEPTAVGDDRPTIPVTATLSQNFPNPFNPTTTISFSLDRRAVVELAVFNLLGQQVATLLSSELPPGSHRVEWDGRDADGHPVSSGIYLYRLTADGHSLARKMLLVK